MGLAVEEEDKSFLTYEFVKAPQRAFTFINNHTFAAKFL